MAASKNNLQCLWKQIFRLLPPSPRALGIIPGVARDNKCYLLVMMKLLEEYCLLSSDIV